MHTNQQMCETHLIVSNILYLIFYNNVILPYKEPEEYHW